MNQRAFINPWILFVIGTMLISFAFIMVLIVKGTGDPALATTPNYYERSLKWDEEQRENARNDALGWEAHWSAIPQSDGSQLILRITDNQGNPVNGEISSEGFFNSNPMNVRSIEFGTSEPGVYTAKLERPDVGWWRLRAEIRANGTRFTTQDQLFLVPKQSPASSDRKTSES
ncbi:MAG: FixH family protein [Planctomycetota bacterium]